MTISANDRRKDYAGNDVTVSFTGPRAFSASHISVYLTDDATGDATLTTAYTISNVGVRNRQTVVMTQPPRGGQCRPVHAEGRQVRSGRVRELLGLDAVDVTFGRIIQRPGDGLDDQRAGVRGCGVGMCEWFDVVVVHGGNTSGSRG